MTDDDRIHLLKLNDELMAKIKPLQEQLKPLNAQLNAITELIVSDLKPEFVYSVMPWDCGDVALLKQVHHC